MHDVCSLGVYHGEAFLANLGECCTKVEEEADRLNRLMSAGKLPASKEQKRNVSHTSCGKEAAFMRPQNEGDLRGLSFECGQYFLTLG